MGLDESYSYEFSIGFLGARRLCISRIHPHSPCCSPALGTDSKTAGLVGTATRGQPSQPSCDSRLGTSPGTASAGAPWGWSSQRTFRRTSGHGSPPPAGPGAELGSCCIPAPETLATVGMGDVGQAPWPLRFLPAQMSVQPTPALGRFTEQQ